MEILLLYNSDLRSPVSIFKTIAMTSSLDGLHIDLSLVLVFAVPLIVHRDPMSLLSRPHF